VTGGVGNGSIVEADRGIGEASGAVDGNESCDGICSDIVEGRGTAIFRFFEDGVDASEAASFCLHQLSMLGRKARHTMYA